MQPTRPAAPKRRRPRPEAPLEEHDRGEVQAALVVVGDDDEVGGICASLANIKARIDRVESVDAAAERAATDALACIWSCIDVERGFGREVGRLKSAAPIPIYAVVRDEADERWARALYRAGVSGVFAWPREGLLMARYVAEMLSLRMVRGPAQSPQAALARTVRAHLRQLPMVDLPIDVEVEWGRVLLSGSVESLAARDEIEHRVAMVPGVVGLDTRGLSVNPIPEPDATIRHACRSILSVEGVVRTVAVAVDGGRVRFAGTLTDRKTAQRIRELAAQVRGVREIELDFDVSSAAVRRDRRTQRRLQDLITALFTDSDVRLTIYSGVAVLEGTVDSLRIKRSIGRMMEQETVISTVVNKLEVSPESRR